MASFPLFLQVCASNFVEHSVRVDGHEGDEPPALVILNFQFECSGIAYSEIWPCRRHMRRCEGGN